MELSLDAAHKAITRQFKNKPRELYDTLCERYKHKEVNHICDDFVCLITAQPGDGKPLSSHFDLLDDLYGKVSTFSDNDSDNVYLPYNVRAGLLLRSVPQKPYASTISHFNMGKIVNTEEAYTDIKNALL